MFTIGAITMDSYAPGLFHLQQPLKIPLKSHPCMPLYAKSNSLGKYTNFWISFFGSLCLFLDITLLYSNLPDVRRNLSFTVIYLLH